MQAGDEEQDFEMAVTVGNDNVAPAESNETFAHLRAAVRKQTKAAWAA